MTPVVGEIIVDTTLKQLRVGDGSTAGGVKAARTSDLPAASSTTVSGLVEKATDAEVYGSTTDKNITADHLTSASASVALTDAATVAVDWTAGINFSLTTTQNCAIGNPTSEIPGTYRTIVVQGNDATDRTITFGAEFLGDIPTIIDCDSGKWYLLTIRCIAASHFFVTASVVKKP
jgi:hypothetical protein